MSKESLNPAGLAEPKGPYANVTAAAPGGRLVFTAGAVAFDASGEIVGVGDVLAQTEQVMANLEIALAAAGAGFADVTKITMYMVDVTDYPKVAQVRQRYLSEPFPASTLIGVDTLMYPELLVEIEAVAVVHD
jgi:enamine deaminase RidA (YjgF/YER057c/UK114 family)